MNPHQKADLIGAGPVIVNGDIIFYASPGETAPHHVVIYLGGDVASDHASRRVWSRCRGRRHVPNIIS